MRVSPPSALVALAAALLLAGGGCQASPPRFDPNGPPTPDGSSYAALATCAANPNCPASLCNRALGAPDSRTVDLQRCPVVDLLFTGGSVVVRQGKPDLTVTFGTISGITRVEASSDGVDFAIVGYVGGLPAGAAKSCLAELSGTTASVYLDRCNTVSNVTQLRVLRDTTVSGAATLDAVKAESFAAPGS